MLQSTSSNQQIVNARILAEMAVQFNIGADILGKGNRHVESKLGAENLSGDTVMVPIVDGGEVYDKLDLSGKDLSVARDAVPVTVKPLTTAAAISQEDLTLSIKNPEIMGKRVANMALTASNMAVNCLEANALNATVINNADITGAGAGYTGRSKLYDLVALCEGSKLAGETYGVVHPLVWAKLIAMFQGNYAPNDKVGNELYKNELGELAGIRWTKTQLLKLITATAMSGNVSFDYATTMLNQAYYDVQAGNSVPSSQFNAGVSITNHVSFFGAGVIGDYKPGTLSQPFGLDSAEGNPINSTDIFGNDTGHRAVFHLVAVDTDGDGKSDSAVLAAPVFFEGPRTNVFCKDYVKVSDGGGKLENCVARNILTNGQQYLPPALVWKRDDFLVAVKGLEKYYGSDSLTIPTTYKDKNILPLRGWAWTDPERARTLFRVDVLLGCAAYTRTSMNALYIQAN